jgi:hypothetical protein
MKAQLAKVFEFICKKIVLAIDFNIFAKLKSKCKNVIRDSRHETYSKYDKVAGLR